jgi:hypothetical protein
VQSFAVDYEKTAYWNGRSFRNTLKGEKILGSGYLELTRLLSWKKVEGETSM